MLKDFTRKKIKGGKLKNRYVGPHVIPKSLPHGVYELTDVKNERNTLRVTGTHLKPYVLQIHPAINSASSAPSPPIPPAYLQNPITPASLSPRVTSVGLVRPPPKSLTVNLKEELSFIPPLPLSSSTP